MDLDKLASRFTTELHLDIPFLGRVVNEVVHDAHGKGLKPDDLRMFLADGIEDGLGHIGQGLSGYLNAEAFADWRGICGRAFDKALVRVLSYADAP